MAVTTTARVISIFKRICADHPQFQYQRGLDFYWSSNNKTVVYTSIKTDEDLGLLLHEIGHGLLAHDGYQQDIELLQLERAAWDEALRISDRYEIKILEDYIEEALDSYREWLHARSRCPRCQNAGTQRSSSLVYYCSICQTTWQANQARACALRRFRIT